MSYTTLRWMGILFPALLVGLFESLRHSFLEQILPGMLGNFATLFLVMSVTFFFFQRLFRAMDRIDRRLASEQRKTALLQERDRIAREMHDGLGQSLFFLNIKLQSAEKNIGEGHLNQVRSDVEESRSVITDLYTRVRHTIYDLKNASRDDWTLDGAIETTLDEIQEQSGLATHLEVTVKNDAARNSAEAFHLLRIAREAIYNANRHGKPSEIRVVLDIDESGTCLLEVRDNGRGFDPASRKRKGHFGLSMMQERASLIGAELQVTSAPGKGTAVRLRVPLVVDHKKIETGGTSIG